VVIRSPTLARTDALRRATQLLIADISGYTGYLAEVELDHAQDILADLIGAVVTALRPNFRLAKLEGDAAFTYMPAEQVDGSMLLDTIERCYFGFRRRRRDVRQATSCECNACTRIPDLDLKFVVHHGAARIAQASGCSRPPARPATVGSGPISLARRHCCSRLAHCSGCLAQPRWPSETHRSWRCPRPLLWSP
jgi:hypothetical protein